MASQTDRCWALHCIACTLNLSEILALDIVCSIIVMLTTLKSTTQLNIYQKYWSNSATSDRRIMQDTCSRTSYIAFRLWKCTSSWSPTEGAATFTKGTELCCSPNYPYKEIRTHHTRAAAVTLAARSYATKVLLFT